MTYTVSPNFDWVSESVRDLVSEDVFHIVTAVNVNSRRDLKNPRYLSINPERNDQVWEHIAKLRDIRTICMNDGEVAPESFREIAKLHRLRDILFTRVALTDAATKNLESLSELRSVELYESGLSDESIGVFARMDSLQRLVLTGCQLSDQALEVISSSDSITELSFADSTREITDEGAAAIAKMPRLKL